VRFPCGECGKRLKAKVPSGTRKIATICTACKAQVITAVSVGGAGSAAQQSGRARHMAGGGTAPNLHQNPAEGSDTGVSTCDSSRCSCTAQQRRLLVRHPLTQLQKLIEQNLARVPSTGAATSTSI